MTHLACALLALTCALAFDAGARAAPPRPTRDQIARMNELQEKADAAREAQRFLEAAAYLDEAFAIYPDPRWLANAGYCRMMAGEQVDAIKDFTAALKDPRLTGEARDRAKERLESSKVVLEMVQLGDAAEVAGDHAEAARRYDSAFEVIHAGRYLVRAADLWRRAGDREAARTRYAQAEPRLDLSDADRAAVKKGLAPGPAVGPGPEVSPDEPGADDAGGDAPVLGWVLVGTGAAVLGLGIAGFVVSGSEHATAEDATELAAFRDHDDRAETWWNVGLIATAVGVAASATGAVLVITHDPGPKTRGSVDVSGGLTRGGAVVTATVAF